MPTRSVSYYRTLHRLSSYDHNDGTTELDFEKSAYLLSTKVIYSQIQSSQTSRLYAHMTINKIVVCR